jgi:formamidopyrimidine-DNA glycosylase
MPELPEIEATCQGLVPYVMGQQISDVIIRCWQLRWTISVNLVKLLRGQNIQGVNRRAKYILISCSNGTLIIHLGMTGRLNVVPNNTLSAKHDHVDIILSNGKTIRYTDSRRFGSIHWTAADPYKHRLLLNLGIEPLTKEFTGNYLFNKAIKKNIPIKSFLMDATIVVGIGNIYANEALFASKIKPHRLVNTIKLEKYNNLAKNIQIILKKSIHKGGTTVRDFLNVGGEPGYFVQELKVYGRQGKPCFKCNTLLKGMRLNQRLTVYCPKCQH